MPLLVAGKNSGKGRLCHENCFSPPCSSKTIAPMSPELDPTIEKQCRFIGNLGLMAY